MERQVTFDFRGPRHPLEVFLSHYNRLAAKKTIYPELFTRLARSDVPQGSGILLNWDYAHSTIDAVSIYSIFPNLRRFSEGVSRALMHQVVGENGRPVTIEQWERMLMRKSPRDARIGLIYGVEEFFEDSGNDHVLLLQNKPIDIWIMPEPVNESFPDLPFEYGFGELPVYLKGTERPLYLWPKSKKY